MSILSTLSREQKEAVGLLQIGTFLEYFDLMLYVHMAVLLNELFFPKTDPHTAALLSAFAFCSTFVLRPFGALIFGYIGDHVGRKATVIITTMLMSVSCIIMANLPTYAQVGISAAWIITICRMIQGLSSMGEIMGAQIYMAEITKPPVQYPAVSFISVAASFGGFAALGVASLVTSQGFNWRIAFWVGACIAVIGSMARTRLRETPEFIAAMNQKNARLSGYQESIQTEPYTVQNEKTSRKTMLAFFAIYCGHPLCFYLIYIFFNTTLKETFDYSTADVIYHNFLLSLSHLPFSIFISLLSFKVYPLLISKVKGYIFLTVVVLLPFLMMNANSHYAIFAIQAFLLIGTLNDYPSVAIFLRYFSVSKRVTATSFLYATTRAIMYIMTTFGLVYLTEWVGNFGLWCVTLPVTCAFLWGIHHFERLEREQGVHPYKKKPPSDLCAAPDNVRYRAAV